MGEINDAGRIVASILQPLEAFKYNWHHTAVAYISDNSAHSYSTFTKRGKCPFIKTRSP
jgi:hypothetical protein